MEEKKLAIIIPYYKYTYIHQTLASIEAQTNRNFTLYIGDDGSDYPLNESLNKLSEDFRTQITYVRFENNLGSSSLVRQWERCIGLSLHEPYIWLFSDDDIMPADAVERFYDLIDQKNGVPVARFNIEIINDKGEVIREMVPHPAFETAEQFIKRRLAGACISTACEYIFSRAVYEEKNGFVDLPLAWAADDATWAIFAEGDGIYTIPGKPVSWRMSGLNISSDTGASFRNKIEASVLFIKLMNERFFIGNAEKLTWLQQQLYFFKPTLQRKIDFYKQILESRLFTNSFIAVFLARQFVTKFWERIKRKLRQ